MPSSDIVAGTIWLLLWFCCFEFCLSDCHFNSASYSSSFPFPTLFFLRPTSRLLPTSYTQELSVSTCVYSPCHWPLATHQWHWPPAFASFFVFIVHVLVSPYPDMTVCGDTVSTHTRLNWNVAFVATLTLPYSSCLLASAQWATCRAWHGSEWWVWDGRFEQCHSHFALSYGMQVKKYSRACWKFAIFWSA